jgi:hypothetical protein
MTILAAAIAMGALVSILLVLNTAGFDHAGTGLLVLLSLLLVGVAVAFVFIVAAAKLVNRLRRVRGDAEWYGTPAAASRMYPAQEARWAA